jgi:hypothetical protein
MSPGDSEYSAFRCGEHASQLAALEQRTEKLEACMKTVEDGDRQKAASDKRAAMRMALYTAICTSAASIATTLIARAIH